jgi:hypothetical protein
MIPHPIIRILCYAALIAVGYIVGRWLRWSKDLGEK